MEYDITQHLTGILMVTAELRTTVVVMPGMYGVDAFQLRLLLQLGSEALGDAVDTSYCGNNPYLIADTNLTILTYISIKGTVYLRYVKIFIYRVICV